MTTIIIVTVTVIVVCLSVFGGIIVISACMLPSQISQDEGE
ncbi:MAG: hypothetical protein WAV56_00515 [Microgenomates group bacterium]